jgi:hypothetical protein
MIDRFTAMQKMTAAKLAKIYGVSRQAIHAHVKKGNISKGSDGLIDFAEAIRALGEPQNYTDDVNLNLSINNEKLTEIDALKQQIDMLEKQLNIYEKREEQALTREQFYQDQIEKMQLLLIAPTVQKTDNQNSESEISHQQIHVTEQNEQKPISKKLRFLKKFFE